MPGFEHLVLSCEHAGNQVPAELAGVFAGARRELASHRGFDRGALALAQSLAHALDAPLIATRWSRLVVDTNRSLGNPGVWSPRMRELPAARRGRLAERFHHRHRERVAAAIEAAQRGGGRVLHLAVHSFTPVLHGVPRRTDLGLLYDPRRAGERALCERWKRLLAASAPGLRVRRNHPYRGDADGLTRTLRRRFPARAYLGVELELCQARVDARGRPSAALVARLIASLHELRAEPRSKRKPRC